MEIDRERLSMFVADLVAAAFQEDSERYTKDLAKSVDWDDGWEKVSTRYAYNAVQVSAKLAVQTTLEVLFATGLLKFSPDDYHPLRLIWDDGQVPPEQSP